MHHLVPALAAALVIATAATGVAVDGRVDASRQAAYPQVLTSVVNKSMVNGYWTNMGQVIGSCKVGTSGSVKKITHLGVGLAQTQTSGLLTAFNPSSTHIYGV